MTISDCIKKLEQWRKVKPYHRRWAIDSKSTRKGKTWVELIDLDDRNSPFISVGRRSLLEALNAAVRRAK